MKALAGIMSLVVLLGAACAAELNTPEQLYQKALHLETAKADYQGAIPIYATIISNHEQNATFTIKALYRQGVCYEKTGQAEQAEQCAQKLANQYADAVKTNAEMVEWVGHYVKADESATARQQILDKMSRIVIPKLEFVQANIVDVIKYLSQASIAIDKDSAPGEKGVNFVLQLKRPGTAAETAPAPGTAAAAATNVPTVTMDLRNIRLIDAIKYITEVTRMKYRIDENAVVITQSDMADGELITRTYKILPSVASSIAETIIGATGSSVGADFKKFFVEAGMPFPESTSIDYKPNLNLLSVKNTADNLESFERILTALNVVPVIVKVQADHVEITDPDTAQQFQHQAPTAEELRSLPSTAFRRHSTLAVITRSGSNAESGSMPMSEDGQVTNAIGTVLNCTPTVGPDGYTIDLVFLWRSNTLLGTNPPFIANMALTQALAIWDGQAMVLPVQYQRPDQLAEKALSPNPQYVIIAATLIDPAGQPIQKSVRESAQRPKQPGQMWQNASFSQSQKIEGVWWDGTFLNLSYRGDVQVVETPIGPAGSSLDGLAFHPDGRIAFSAGHGTEKDVCIAYWSTNDDFNPVVNIKFKYFEFKEGQDQSALEKSALENLENQGVFWYFAGPLAFDADGTCYFSLGGCEPNGIFKVKSSKPVMIEKLHSIGSASSLQVPVFDKSRLYSTSWNGIFRYSMTASSTQKSNPWFTIAGEGILMGKSLIISPTRVVVDILIDRKSNTKKEDGYDHIALIFDRELKAYWSLTVGDPFHNLIDVFGPMAISWDGKQMIHFNSNTHSINEFSLGGITTHPVAAGDQ